MTFWYILHIFEQGDWALAGQMFMCNRLGSACKACKSPQITSIWFSRGLPMKTHLLGLLQEGGRVQAIDVCWISGSWIFISKDYEALKTKLKGSTNLSNVFFVALKCFEMVCIKWIKCVFLPLVAFYRVWVSQRVWVDIPVNDGLMVGNWLFQFEGAGLMCTSLLGCCEWNIHSQLESTFVLTRVSFKSQKI